MITIDSQAGVVTVEDGGRTRTLRKDEPEAFRHKYAAGRLKEI